MPQEPENQAGEKTQSKNCLTCYWWKPNPTGGSCKNTNWCNGKNSDPEDPVCGMTPNKTKPTSWLDADMAKAKIKEQEAQETQA